MSYYQINKERIKQYNLNRYHQMPEDKKEELNNKRGIYYKQYYDKTKTLKGYNKTKTFDKKKYYRNYEIKNKVKLQLYRQKYYAEHRQQNVGHFNAEYKEKKEPVAAPLARMQPVDKKEYYKMYEIKNNVKLRMYRQEYNKKKYLNILHNVAPPTSTELDLYDIY